MPRTDLRDSRGRLFESLRVSVTDRCNLRCHYCMPPEGMEWFPRGEILSFEELSRVASVAAGMGIRRVRVTGGEPLLRRDLPAFVRMLADVPGLDDVALTTNAVLLPEHGEALAEAGLRRVNVSLDSLDRSTFAEMTGRDLLPRVLEGVEVARRLFPPVKVNVVLIRGVNDDEPLRFAEFAREKGIAVRFIEYMPLGGAAWGADRVVPSSEVRRGIEAVHPLVPMPRPHPGQPSRDFGFADGAHGSIGLIHPITAPFCERCDRLRLTADGKIKNCMFDRGEVDVRAALRAGATDEEIAGRIREAARAKGSGGLVSSGRGRKPGALRSMSRLGG